VTQLKTLITAGGTREPIDAVRFIGNRSSGKMGAALCSAALAAGHEVCVIAGPGCAGTVAHARRIDIETAADMHAAVLREFPHFDLLIMAAAVADFRPRRVVRGKLERGGELMIECEPTDDILAAVGATKRSGQRTVGFSLESTGDVERAREKMLRKRADLIVFNRIETMESGEIEPVLLWPDGKTEILGPRSKDDFAALLMARAAELFP
jgi:phosphopantothenoylcysteine decarboxylase/phosphopantothenate--cysteine ligase